MKKYVRIAIITIFIICFAYGFITEFIPLIKMGFTKNVEPEIYIKNIKTTGCNVINKTSKNKKNYFYYETDEDCFYKGKYIYTNDNNLIKIGKKLQKDFYNKDNETRITYNSKVQVFNYYSHIAEGEKFYLFIYNRKRILYFTCESKDQDKIIKMIHKMGYGTPEQKSEIKLSLEDRFFNFIFDKFIIANN